MIQKETRPRTAATQRRGTALYLIGYCELRQGLRTFRVSRIRTIEILPTTEEPDGCVVLQMQTRGKNELARWVAGYGGTVEVLEPSELREAVRSLGQAIVDRYV